MTNVGIGQDGYLRYQLESSYGTAITSSMTLLPVKPGTELNAYPEFIENDNIIASRLKQDPNKGREIRKFKIVMDHHFPLFGAILNWFFGAAANTTDNGDGSYTHAFLCPFSGTRVSKSATIQGAPGGLTADQIDGAVIMKMACTVDNTGKLEWTIEGNAQGLVEAVARITSFSYPTAVPAHFGFISATITPDGGGAVTYRATSMTANIDFQYNEESYYLGSTEILQPTFNDIPQVTFGFNVEGVDTFRDEARDHNHFDLDIEILSTIDQPGSSEYYRTSFEIQKARLAPDTIIPYNNQQIVMDLSFDCGYGGTTTNSGTDPVMFEVRHTDATASYT